MVHEKGPLSRSTKIEGRITTSSAASSPAESPAWNTLNFVTSSAQAVVAGVTSYFTAKSALGTFSSTIPPNSNTLAIYNDGKLVVPAGVTSPTGQNIVVYNSARGELLIAPPAQSTKVACPRCRLEFNSSTEAQAHRKSMPEYCRVHSLCFDSWEEHNAENRHRRCGVVGCPKATVDFGNNARYLQHHRNKHKVS